MLARRQLLLVLAPVGLVALLLLGVYVSPGETKLDGGSNLLLVLLTGLTVGGVSCLAIQAGLLATAVARRDDGGVGEREAQLRKQAALEGNAAPIVWFLGAKLLTYSALGALLGFFGSLLDPSPTLRGWVQAATALFMVATALQLLRVHPVFRYVVIQPPRFVTKRIRREAKSQTAFAPAVLGAMTIFLPCGVTQAMEVLAINAGSPWLGAGIMFAFILGTTPLFFLLGYTATRLGGGTQRRFMQAAGALILVFGLVTFNAAMNLLDKPISYQALQDRFTTQGPAVAAVAAAGGVQEVRIHAGAYGYSPARVTIESGKAARVVFVTDPDAGCTRAVLLLGKMSILPATGNTVVSIAPQKPGLIRYVCGMGMYRGSISVV
jgi:sulfite exporter TauE/SafE